MKLQPKLALFSTGIALIAVTVVAVVSRRTTLHEVNVQLAEADVDKTDTAVRIVRDWHVQHPSWQDAQGVIDQAASQSGCDLLLINYAGRCIASAPSTLCQADLTFGSGDLLTIRMRDTAQADVRELIGPPRVVFRDDRDATRLATLFILPPTNAEPIRFLRVMSQSLWIAGLVAAAVSVVLSIVIARAIVRPVRALTRVVARMGTGDLSPRVEVKGADEIAELAAAFNAMAASMSLQERGRQDLFHDVAHELRTPLTNLQCQLEAILDGLDQPEPRTLQSMHEELMLLGRLVDDLRDVALAEAGQLRLFIEPCELMTEVGKAVRAVAAQAAARGVHLRVDGPEAAMAYVDVGRFGQILGNLLSNGIRHASAGGNIDIRVRQSQSETSVEVEDDGPGIADELRPRVWERFFRADGARSRATGGVGLGLAIVKHLTELHGGTAGVENVPGRGARFTVTFRAPLNG